MSCSIRTEKKEDSGKNLRPISFHVKLYGDRSSRYSPATIQMTIAPGDDFSSPFISNLPFLPSSFHVHLHPGVRGLPRSRSALMLLSLRAIELEDLLDLLCIYVCVYADHIRLCVCRFTYTTGFFSTAYTKFASTKNGREKNEVHTYTHILVLYRRDLTAQCANFGIFSGAHCVDL